jgi:uncharacterized SAM-binding protein YcdF (DUF218 family)
MLRSSGLFGFVWRLLTRLTLLIVLALGVGFVLFANSLSARPPPVPRADAIVVVTGGADRLDRAMTILEQGAGSRLLISGVSLGTSRDDLQARLGRTNGHFDCCVDLGWAARDTRGNAEETARWAREHGYRSLIVVTANYHMPRTLLELGSVMPEVELIAYPVEPRSIEVDNWWRDPQTLRLLAGEYVKYVASLARLGADRAFG